MASDSERVASTVPTSEDLILQAQVPVTGIFTGRRIRGASGAEAHSEPREPSAKSSDFCLGPKERRADSSEFAPKKG